MKPGDRSYLLLVILTALLLRVPVSSQTTGPTTAPYSPQQLRAAAEQTYVNFNKAWQAGLETRADQIPAKYWADPIQALQPIRVYLHRANMVIVQHETGDIEEGKYIYLSISSYLPTSGVDGFEITPNPHNGDRYILGNGVFDYKRTTPR